MNLEREYGLDEGEVNSLAQIEDSPPALAILKVALAIHKRETKKIMDGLTGVNEAEPRNDYRHSIGAASTAAKILGLRNEALEQQNITNSRR